jgi:alkanesulfonate monooxygenase SsuD/methylene tetrahydromethanopterin reductase-like flavin-dependent oxidoreductase (luciferase family)
MADRAGIEALVPVARWKGFGGKTNFHGTCCETYTWAAGLAAATRQVAVFSTSHVPTVHPIVVCGSKPLTLTLSRRERGQETRAKERST